MNRPTIDVDDLLDLADEALDAGDLPQAVEILRKAASVAPLRKDIRNRLAIALEGAPKARCLSANGAVQPAKDNVPVEGDYGLGAAYPELDDDDRQGREAISQIARKAFDAAAGHTAKAGVATRNLTNLLQQGIKNWKSSLSDVKNKSDCALNASSAADLDIDVSRVTRSNVFTPEKDLREYLERVSEEEPELDQDNQFFPEDVDSKPQVAERLTRTVARSNKSSRTVAQKKQSRPTDVEDVIAAGIGGFIEAIGQANKTKIAYGIAYVVLTGLFCYACFDVSRKFPGVETIPGREVQAASLRALDLVGANGSDDAIAMARSFVAAGNTSEAITLLRQELQSGKLLHNRDLVRIELAAVLNGVAEQHLRSNQFEESVTTYREALSILSSDPALKLRLGNALYYKGTLGDAAPDEKKAALSDAAEILRELTKKDSANLQAHRLYALVNEARGENDTATAAWKQVKVLAAANSAEFREAESHLK